jgi:predicted Zn-dependent protease
MQINFTRANEYEADRIGIGILANAGFDPDAMGDFFWILQKNTGRASDQVPEFLRTHPVSDARVAEARNRAAQYKTDKQIKDSKEFRQAQMQILVRTSADVGRLQQRLEKSIPDDVSDRSEILEYGLALSLHRQEKFEQAQQLIDSLLEKAPRDGNYLRLAGANAFALGKKVRGREIFEGLLNIYPLHYPTLIQYADSLEGVGENEAATKLLREFVRNSDRERPHAYALLARNAEKAGHQLESLEALAENYYLTGRPKLAVSQLKRASELVQPGSTDELRIKDKLIKMRAEAAEALREYP